MAAEEKDKAPAQGGEALESGGYEVIRARLLAQGKALADKPTALNERRKQAFGGSELQVIANERVRTEHACVPADIVQVGGCLLLGYNVFFGMKKEVGVGDVFSLDLALPHVMRENDVDGAPRVLALRRHSHTPAWILDGRADGAIDLVVDQVGDIAASIHRWRR